MAVLVKTKKGKQILLLNPSEKSKKYAQELKHGAKMTNSGELKEKNGELLELTPVQVGFRIGYLKSRSDSAKAFKSKRKKV